MSNSETRTRQRVVIVGGGAAGFFAAINAPKPTLTCTSPSLKRLRTSCRKCAFRVADDAMSPIAFPSQKSSVKIIRAAARRSSARSTRLLHATPWSGSNPEASNLKIEPDGRMFPTTDSSRPIIDCLIESAPRAGIELRTNRAVESVKKSPERLRTRYSQTAKQFTATSLCSPPADAARRPAGTAVSLGHTLEAPVPSLFTFHVARPWLREFAGISVPPSTSRCPDREVPRTRPNAHHAFWPERSGDSATVRMGRARFACGRLQIRVALNWLLTIERSSLWHNN